MITRIHSIKHLGIFRDYSDNREISDFSRYNLIYGWNGSGKTTLTRLFSAVSEGESDKYPDLEYRLTADDASLKHGDVYSNRIAVFNEEYVEKNAPSINDSSVSSKHIFNMGEEAKEIASQIALDETQKANLEDMLQQDDKTQGKVSLLKQKRDAEKNYGDLFTRIAKEIASIRIGEAVRSYNKRDALKRFSAMTAKSELKPAAKEEHLARVNQKALKSIDILSLGSVTNSNGEPIPALDLLMKVQNECKELLEQTTQQKIIERLDENPDIAEWVATGVELHEKHSSQNCEYCLQTIPHPRLEELAAHFNEKHKLMILKIQELLETLELIEDQTSKFAPIDSLNLYSDIQTEYTKEKAKLSIELQSILKSLLELKKVLEEKRLKANKSLKCPSLSISNISERLGSVNKLIKKHNEITDDFSKRVEDSKDLIEVHYLSTIFDKAKQYEQEVNQVNAQVESTQAEIKTLAESINSQKAEIRNTKIGCDQINELLQDLLASNEIEFADEDEGYVIKRRNEIAQDLSEGEKTVISFAYFIVYLHSADFNLQKDIVVIDDPISSLDLNFIYRVTAEINRKLGKSSQLFVLTHNNEFFRQIRAWFINNFKDTSSFFMIDNQHDLTLECRVAVIEPLDPLLKDYESEYHYLFKKLLNYKEDVQEKDRRKIEHIYPYPNFARKVMECFLSFRVPTDKTIGSKISNLQKFSQDIKAADTSDVFLFVNSHSHLDSKTGFIHFDPTLGQNGEYYIKKTLELIRKSDPPHYEAMVRLVS